MPEELRMTHQRGLPQRSVGDAGRAHLVVRDELRLGLLNLHQLAELGQLGRLPFADGLRMGLEDTQHFIAVMRVPSEHAGPGLSSDPLDQRHGVRKRWRSGANGPVARSRLTRSTRSAYRTTRPVIRRSSR